jgi:hypothetical protein
MQLCKVLTRLLRFQIPRLRGEEVSSVNVEIHPDTITHYQHINNASIETWGTKEVAVRIRQRNQTTLQVQYSYCDIRATAK